MTTSQSSCPVYTDGRIRVNTMILLDTGSSVTTMNELLWKKIKIHGEKLGKH